VVLVAEGRGSTSQRPSVGGGDRRNWDRTLLSDCHLAHGGHTDAYGRMWWDKPASGLTTRCLSYSNGRFGHPEQGRAISLPEAALIQTFPQSFRFEGSLTSRGRQVGNAVPPVMAKRIVASATELSLRDPVPGKEVPSDVRNRPTNTLVSLIVLYPRYVVSAGRGTAMDPGRG
jgi:hypothetical protein